jgi:hypothetical protein
MMGWVFANLKVKDVQDNRVASSLCGFHGFTAIIVMSNLRGARLPFFGLRLPQLGSRCIQEKFQPAARRSALLAIRSAHSHQRSLATIERACVRTTNKDHQITLVQLL